MAQSQFKFNPEDLNFDRLDNSLKARIWKVVIFVAAILVIAILLNVIYSLFFDTPRERQIRRENEMLMEQYELLSERKNLVDTVMQEVQRIDKNIYRVIFETEPVETATDRSTELAYQHLMGIPDRKIVTLTGHRLDSLIDHDQMTASLYDVLMIKGENRSEMLPAIPGIQPMPPSPRSFPRLSDGDA